MFLESLKNIRPPLNFVPKMILSLVILKYRKFTLNYTQYTVSPPGSSGQIATFWRRWMKNCLHQKLSLQIIHLTEDISQFTFIGENWNLSIWPRRYLTWTYGTYNFKRYIQCWIRKKKYLFSFITVKVKKRIFVNITVFVTILIELLKIFNTLNIY